MTTKVQKAVSILLFVLLLLIFGLSLHFVWPAPTSAGGAGRAQLPFRFCTTGTTSTGTSARRWENRTAIEENSVFVFQDQFVLFAEIVFFARDFFRCGGTVFEIMNFRKRLTKASL